MVKVASDDLAPVLLELMQLLKSSANKLVPKRTERNDFFIVNFYSRKQLLSLAGFLTSLFSCAFPTVKLKVAFLQEKHVRVTAAGTVPELHRLPFYSIQHGHQRCSKDK